jgi:hypothetical protein
VSKFGSQVLSSDDKDDFFRYFAGNAQRVWNYTVLPIPQECWADVDAGLVYAETLGFGVSSTKQDDIGAIVTSATLATGDTPRHAISTVSKSKTWTPLSSTLKLPSGTRSVRCGFLAYRVAGGQEFVYRRVSVNLVKDLAEPRVDLAKPSFPANPADWVDAKGGVVSVVNDSWGISTPVTMGKTMDLRSVEDLPASLLTQIDAGEVAFRFHAFLNFVDGGDFGRTYVEFLDEADAVVGRRKWDAQTPYYPATMQSIDIAVPIPVGARKVVIGVFGSKDYGETSTTVPPNFQTSLHQAYCYVPLPGDMPDPAPEPPVLEEDEHWDSVRLLLTTRNGVIENLADTSMRALTVAGETAVADVDSPFGTTAIKNNLEASADNNDFLDIDLFGGGYGPKMTFEGWVMKTGHSARQWAQLHNQIGNGGDSAGDPMRLSSIPPYGQSDVQLAWNEWYHFALCRDETGRAVVFINGKRQTREGGASTQQWLSHFFLGKAGTSGSESSWTGYFDEIRLTDGVERYTEDFVVPEQRWPAGPVVEPAAPADAVVEAAWGVESLAAIYSLRLTVPEYTGPLVRGVRKSDGAKKDFFAGPRGWIDTSEVATWANGADVYVERWYDQSANGRHAGSYVYSANVLPLLAVAGVVPEIDGVPFIRFGDISVNVKSWLLLPFNIFKAPFTVLFTGRRTSNGGNGGWAALFSGALSSNGLGMGYNPSLVPSLQANGSSDNSGGLTWPLNATYINSFTSAAAYAASTAFTVTPHVAKAVSAVRSLNFGTRTLTDDFTYVGGSANDASHFMGLISEIVIAPAALSDADRQTIESKMKVVDLPLVNAPAARFWRIRGTPQSNNTLAVAEIELRGVPGGPDLTGSGVAIASSEYNTGDHGKQNAFNNVMNDRWASVDTTADKWIGYDFGAGHSVAVNEVWIKSRTDIAYQSPISFRVDYSSDGTNWTTLWIEGGLPTWAVGEERVFTNPGYDPGAEVPSDALSLSGETGRLLLSGDAQTGTDKLQLEQE